MNYKTWTILLLFSLFTWSVANAQQRTLTGSVVAAKGNRPIEFASVQVKDHDLWAFTDQQGQFTIKNVPDGSLTLVVQSLGYVQRTITLTAANDDVQPLLITMSEDNLTLDEVEVTAKRSADEATTSYTIDRMTLDNQQIVNVGEISTLLPGGKTVNSTLINDDRMALRSSTSEKGNASFGTAVEVDGVRVDNNAVMGETTGASTRTISSSNIESVEVVTGIPSVEYGDLSNGVVKVNTRKGKSPFVIEGKLNQHTYQLALNKGFDLGKNRGLLNASFERARSFSDIASPHTAYDRNILSLNYMNVFMKQTNPLTLNVSMTGNIGGYDSKSDPDNALDSYSKMRDNLFRASLNLNWLLNKSWITNIMFKGSFSYQDKKQENYTNASSASTQPYIHTREEGYFVAADYDVDPTANIILGPTGYWYVRGFNDQKPITYSLKLQADWTRRFGSILNKLMVGAEFKASGNNGRGTYYEDMRYAPTWRPYRYNELPWTRNLAIYAEDKLTIPLTDPTAKGYKANELQITAGLRDDITMISGSDYGNVSSFAPRFNTKYIFWEKRNAWISDLSIHGGWGKSYKLPSFQVLYPAPGYADRLAFSSTSTSENKSYYAYHTYPSNPIYNPNLKWQHTNQTDLGIEAKIKGTRVYVSGFYHKTFNPYVSSDIFTPMTYLYTAPSALDGVAIDVANRQFAIDQQTGIVTVSDATGGMQSEQLAYNERKTYVVNQQYRNGSPVSRYGVDWIVDFAQVKSLHTSLRLDGNFYHYKAVDETLFADIPQGVSSTMTGNIPYQYIGWYIGSNATSAGSSFGASVANGSLSSQVNLNATVTTHIPQIRLIVSLRIESSLYNYRRSLSELNGSTRGYVLESSADYFGEPYNRSYRDRYVAVYPEYYTTWDNPTEKIPFAEMFAWAKDNDPTLYNDLSKLVVRTNYPYTMNPERISRYYSANFSVTKEIGDHVSVSFYANNFFNTMKTVHSSQTGLDTSLFSSTYVPSFYYGLSLRLKL